MLHGRVYRYPGSLTGIKQYQVENWAGKVMGLTFGTKIPGGFSDCSFRVDLPFEKAANIYSRYLHNYVVFYSGGGEVAWEGRIEEITLEPGQVTITAYGLWANAFDDYYEDGSLIPAPITENPLTYRDGWAHFTSSVQKLCQTFQLSEARAIKDIQVRLANFGVSTGELVFELRETSESGTLLASSTLQVSALYDDDGFSEYLGLTTEGRLSSGTTYYLLIYPDATYFASIGSYSGVHGVPTGVGYLIATGQDWLLANIQVGTPVTNTTQGYTVHVSGTTLAGLQTPSKVYYSDNGVITDITGTVADDNTGTQYTFSNFNFEEDYIYVGYGSAYGGLYVWPGTSPQGNVTTLGVEYAYSTGWRSVSQLTDGTAVGGIALAQEGTIRWARPTDWVLSEPIGGMGSRYWIRIKFNSGVDTSFTLAELDIGFNNRLDFSDIGSNVWNTGDGYAVYITVAVGLDSGSHYTGGLLKKYDGASWSAYGGDSIFYIWPHPRFYYTGGTSTYASDVIVDVISECVLIDDTDGYFEDTGRVMNPIAFTEKERHGDVIEKVLAFGSSDSDPVPLAFGVWEDGIAKLRKTTDGMQWYADFKNMPVGQQAFSLTNKLSGYKTRSAVLYTDEDGARQVTSWIENADLADMFGYNRSLIMEANDVSTALAESLADMVADVYKVPEQSLSLTIEGYIMDSARKKWPVWMVRAGDIINISLLPTSVSFDSDMLERLVTIYVKETSYDDDSGRLQVTPSSMTRDVLDIILALSGASLGGE